MPVAPSPVPSEERAAAAALDDAKAMTRGDVSEIDVEGMEEGEVDVDGAAQEDEVDDDGVRIYDRSFLLKLQFTNASVMRPTDLPELPDIVLDEVLTTRPHSHKINTSNRRSRCLSFSLNRFTARSLYEVCPTSAPCKQSTADLPRREVRPRNDLRKVAGHLVVGVVRCHAR